MTVDTTCKSSSHIYIYFILPPWWVRSLVVRHNQRSDRFRDPHSGKSPTRLPGECSAVRLSHSWFLCGSAALGAEAILLSADVPNSVTELGHSSPCAQ